IERIERAQLPALARPDSPGSLQQVVERAMSKDPDARYPSAVAFARALQKVQIELTHSVTPIDIVDDHPVADEPDNDDDGLTRVRNVVNIEPDAGFTRPSATTRPFSAPQPAPAADSGPKFSPGKPVTSAIEETVRRPTPQAAAPVESALIDDDRTIVSAPRSVSPEAAVPAPVLAPASPPDSGEAAPKPKSRVGLWVTLAVVAVVAVVGGAIAINMLPAGEDPDPVATQDAVIPKNPVS